MREKFYCIEIYDEQLDQRYIIYRTDIGLFAWFNWWCYKLLADDHIKYPIMIIRT